MIPLALLCALIITTALSASAVPVAAAKQQSPVNEAYAKDEIIVMFEAGTRAAKTHQIGKALGAESVEPINPTTSSSAKASPCVVTLPQGESVKHALKKYQRNPSVAYVQPNYLYSYDDAVDDNETPIARTAAATKNDTDRWNLKKIDTQKAWDLIDEIEAERRQAGKEDLKRVTVAVLDTGVDLEHEDLQEALNPQKCVKVEGQPIPLYPGQTYPLLTGDQGGHGTKVAGIIGATSGNHKGSAGVAAGNNNQIVELAVIDVYDHYYGRYDKLARSSDLIKGIDYAVRPEVNAKVINMSLGHRPKGPRSTKDYALAAKIGEVAREKQVTVVCSAGNKNNTELWYPSDFTDSISVISTVNYSNVFKQCKAPTSNYGKLKDISAPGYHVMVPTKNGGYKADASGTSFAAPVVSAVAAMLYYVNPDAPEKETTAQSTPLLSTYGITSSQIKDILKSTATDLYAKGDDLYTRCGNVNAYAAVAKAAGKTISTAPVRLSPPKLKAVSSGYNKVRLTWNKVSTAQGYNIYRASSANGRYNLVKTLHNGRRTTFTDSSLRIGKKYFYKIKSFGTVDNKKSHSTYSAVARGIPHLTGITGFTVSAQSYRSIHLKWKRVVGARGYQIFRSDSKKGSYKLLKTLVGKTKTAYTDAAGLTAGKTYYYKIRPFTKASGKRIYGKVYSPVKGTKAVPKRSSAITKKTCRPK